MYHLVISIIKVLSVFYFSALRIKWSRIKGLEKAASYFVLVYFIHLIFTFPLGEGTSMYSAWALAPVTQRKEWQLPGQSQGEEMLHETIWNKKPEIVFRRWPEWAQDWKTPGFLSFTLAEMFVHFKNIFNYLVNVCISTYRHSAFTGRCPPPSTMACCSFHFPLPTMLQYTWMHSEMLRIADASRWSRYLEEVSMSFPCQSDVT